MTSSFGARYEYGQEWKKASAGWVAEIQGLLLRMEPELRSLQGTAVVLRALSETADSIEPVALEALARLTDEPLEQITACWQEALDATRGR